mgnify:CR=1 FL=1
MNLTETEKAYLAGLFDGEGTVGYYLKKAIGYHRAQIAIYNSDPRIMEWIRSRIPFGNIVTNKISRHRGWAWMVTSNAQVTEFLVTIRPYLIIKANQVDLLLSLWDAEQKIRGSKKIVKLTSDHLALREMAARQLKLSKTAYFECIH